VCVILISSKGRPTDEVVEACFKQNSEGAGAAWRELDANGVPQVRWIKGISEIKDMQELVRELPIPFITHYRISTVGGGSRLLCHPFIIEPDSPLNLEGTTKEGCLFHNGTWNAWRHQMLESVFKANLRVPTGRWSDSRAMSFLAAHHGLGVLELLDEKIAALTPTQLQVFGTGWHVVEGVGHASNNHWMSRVTKGRPYAVGMAPRESESDPEEDTTLPLITVVSRNGKPTMAEALNRAGGGPAEMVPFDKKSMTYETACELFGQQKMSKSQFKRATTWHFQQLAKQEKKKPPSQPTLH
jgi:hypothetical protein